jgi:hypothetical protein
MAYFAMGKRCPGGSGKTKWSEVKDCMSPSHCAEALAHLCEKGLAKKMLHRNKKSLQSLGGGLYFISCCSAPNFKVSGNRFPILQLKPIGDSNDHC